MFTYDAPSTGVPLTWMAFGASFTQGTESNGIDEHTQTSGVSAQIARAAGVFLGLPLFSRRSRRRCSRATSIPTARRSPAPAPAPPRSRRCRPSPDTGFFDLRYGAPRLDAEEPQRRRRRRQGQRHPERRARHDCAARAHRQRSRHRLHRRGRRRDDVADRSRRGARSRHRLHDRSHGQRPRQAVIAARRSRPRR